MGRRGEISLASAFGELRSDYAAARESRFRRRRIGLPALGGGADYHYRSDADYLRMMEYARDMDRNDNIVGATIDRAVTNTLQEGMQLDPATGDDKLDQDLWAHWHDWAGDADACDVSGELSFCDLETLVFRQHLVDGDVIALLTADGPVQMVEAHRVRTPRTTRRNVVHGVLLDDRRRRLQYWVAPQDTDIHASLKVSDVTPVAVRDADGHRVLCHVYNPRRVSQTRGVTALAPIMDVAGMFEDINFAKLVQQQVVSCFAIFRQHEMGALTAPTPALGALSTETLSDGSSRKLSGIAPGMELIGKPGEKLEGFSPAVPNAEFFDHVKLMLTLIGINLGLPLIMVLMEPSGSFSSYRGAIDQARLGFRRNQRALIRRFHVPVYRWKVRQWMGDDAALARAAARRKVDIFGHTWNPPGWPYIEPLKDAMAETARVRTLQTSPRRAHAQRGADWEEVAGESIADNAFAIVKAKEKAAEINKQFADEHPVHWRELLALPAPDGISLALKADAGEGETEEAGEKVRK